MTQEAASQIDSGSPGLPPILGISQRDRRFARTRSFLREHDLAALVVGGFRGRETYETYLSNESLQGVVVFPSEGDPVHLTWSAFRIIGRSDPGNEREYWIDDIRAGLIGPGLVGVLKERHLESARVGVVGLTSRNPMELEGYVPFGVWSHVAEALPKAQFVEVSGPYGLLMMEKDEEELRLARHAAAVGERACHAMLEATREGALESEVYAAIMNSIYAAGLTVSPPNLIVKSGYNCLSWGPPDWGAGAVAPRRVVAGDLVYAELMPSYGGIETQQQMTVAVGPVSAEAKELAAVARGAYEAGLAALRPGLRFSELCDAMATPLRESGCWNLSPHVHSLSPASLLGILFDGAEAGLGAEYRWMHRIPISMDAEIRQGMLFSFEPNACRGRLRVNIGGTVAVGRSEPEELNSICCRMIDLDNP
ncbi:MAG TPA: M24 family peptidase [Candidatus Dormibacteraeota bacterium]|nr:M24 family peptidase [Candidatus Dormibacteraeota bacterium]